MAFDYLPIQDSSIPYECVFSSSDETDTKMHNWIHPILIEVPQMLKFLLKQQKRPNIIEGGAVAEDELVVDNEDAADLIGRLGSEIR